MDDSFQVKTIKTSCGEITAEVSPLRIFCDSAKITTGGQQSRRYSHPQSSAVTKNLSAKGSFASHKNSNYIIIVLKEFQMSAGQYEEF